MVLWLIFRLFAGLGKLRVIIFETDPATGEFRLMFETTEKKTPDSICVHADVKAL